MHLNCNVSTLRAKKKEKYLLLHPHVTPADATQQLVEEWVVGKKGWKYAEHAKEAQQIERRGSHEQEPSGHSGCYQVVVWTSQAQTCSELSSAHCVKSLESSMKSSRRGGRG